MSRYLYKAGWLFTGNLGTRFPLDSYSEAQAKYLFTRFHNENYRLAHEIISHGKIFCVRYRYHLLASDIEKWGKMFPKWDIFCEREKQ